MFLVWRQFGERGEHEATQVKAWVRQGEKLSLALLVTIKQEIKIHRAGRALLRAAAAEGILDAQQAREQLLRRGQGSAEFRYHV